MKTTGIVRRIDDIGRVVIYIRVSACGFVASESINIIYNSKKVR